MEIENTINKKYLNYDEEDEFDQTFIYFKNTFIYGWGKNKYGELGSGNSENISTPT
jgi:alpha-tubulin suppressor-like RCC1 family protein